MHSPDGSPDSFHSFYHLTLPRPVKGRHPLSMPSSELHGAPATDGISESVVACSPSRSPPFHTAKSRFSPQKLNRKPSLPFLDSSESFPSECDDIFDAYFASKENAENEDPYPWAKVGRRPHVQVLENNPWDTPKGRKGKVKGDETLSSRLDGQHSPPVNSSRLSPQWTGTPLTTISEQKSAANLRPGGGASLPNLSLPLPIEETVASYTSTRSASCNQPLPRRKTSFSLDDLSRVVPVGPHKHLASTSDDVDQLDIGLDFPYPQQPVEEPPQRSPTPPGLPSFGTLEAINYRPLPPPNPRTTSLSLRSLFSTSSQNSSTSGSTRSVGAGFPFPPGVVGRAPDGSLVRGRFAGRNTGHSAGNLDRHPFHNAPIATPATIRVSDEGSPRRPGESTGTLRTYGDSEQVDRLNMTQPDSRRPPAVREPFVMSPSPLRNIHARSSHSRSHSHAQSQPVTNGVPRAGGSMRAGLRGSSNVCSVTGTSNVGFWDRVGAFFARLCGVGCGGRRDGGERTKNREMNRGSFDTTVSASAFEDMLGGQRELRTPTVIGRAF